jgi:N12 class adenine-specific DNA methylase/SAM-dependent methyltransferase
MTRIDTALTALTVDRSPGTALTPDDRSRLLNWPGWGALAPAFDRQPTGKWADVADQLDDLVSPDALAVARDNLDTSFFTPRHVIDTVFRLLTATGFTGGRILEPGCGTGRFMAVSPTNLDIEWTGIDIDPTAAAMARLINPDATILTAPLQKTQFRSGEFDAVIGNVPFSSATVFDPAFESKNLHEYFLLRALDAVREGGYVIIVTSRFMLDAARGLSGVEEHGTLVAALRLPSGTFAAEGTDVVADILMFRKPVRGEDAYGWNDEAGNKPSAEYYSKGYYDRKFSARPTITDPAVNGRVINTEVNAYWRANPTHVAGALKVNGNPRSPLVVVSTDHTADISRALAAVKTKIVPQAERRGLHPVRPLSDVPLTDADGRKEGSFHIIGGVLHEVADGQLAVARESKELRSLIVLRNAAVTLLHLESDPYLADEKIQPARTAAHALYLSYLAAFGPLNRGTLTEGKEDPDTGEPTYTWRRPALGGFRRDPDYSTVMALELFEQVDGTASPAAILLRRVNRHPEPVTRVDTAAEALSVSLGEGRNVDLARIRGLLGLASDADALAALGDLVFDDGRKLAPAREYLTGDVRTKLADARLRAAIDPLWARNVDALEQVLPADKGPADIRVSLGAPWVSVGDVVEFAREILRSSIRLRHTPSVAVWEIEGAANVFTPPEIGLTYGTGRMSPVRILEHALNGKSPSIVDEVWTGFNYVKRRNTVETIAAEEKLKSLDDKFSLWLWEDEARSDRVCKAFNERFNSHVIRRPDGAYLSFPGLAANITPWAQQADAVDRNISTARTLIGHPVGSGKTLEMILTAMTLRRFGLAQKPLIAVPNHLLEQVTREAQQAFPTGRFLIAAKEDLTKERRRLFAARCATGDWDLIVMTHQAFGSLSVSPDEEAGFIERQKLDLRSQMGELPNEYGAATSRGAKAIARGIRSLEGRLESLRYGVQDDDQVRFDHLGIDYLMIDEAHCYRRLDTGSSSRESGFSSGSSKRATDLLLKIELLAARYPDKPIVSLFTGTPWANTLAETWTWQRYLQPDMLERTGTLNFDAWVASFIKYEVAVEVSPDGSGFRVKRRPVGVKNWQQLRTMLWGVADIVNAETLNLPRPEHTLHTLVAQPTPQQKEYITGLAARADAISNRSNPDSNDSMLLVCTDGRKAALDPALVGLAEESSKLRMIADGIAKVYRESESRSYGASPVLGALQLVFCDLGTPRPQETQTYGRIRTLLIAAGVPAAKIRFVHEAKTDKARAALFAQCREGAVSVLLGSTPKVGIGTNIQTRLVALWNVDAPWTPAEVEQRNGRALRPGNLNAHVDIFRCVTEGTFDAFSWQALQRKARAFQKLYEDDTTVTELEDLSAVVLNFGEVKALAAGNPLLLEHATLTSEVQKLRLLRTVHGQSVTRARKAAVDLDVRADSLVGRVQITRRALEAQSKLRTNLADSYPFSAVARAVTGEHSGGVNRVGCFTFRASADRVLVEYDYHELTSLPVAPKTVRRGEEAVAADVHKQFTAWFSDAEDGCVRYLVRADDLRQQAVDNVAAADASMFEQADELAESLAKLARVNAEVAEAALAHEERAMAPVAV